MPTYFAARKWPSSCTNTSTPSTNANDRSVTNALSSLSSDLQFYPADDGLRLLAGPSVHASHFCNGARLDRRVQFQRAFDDVRDRRERDAPFEEPRDRDFVGRVEHDRQAALRLQSPVRQRQTRKRRRVRHVEGEPSRLDRKS